MLRVKDTNHDGVVDKADTVKNVTIVFRKPDGSEFVQGVFDITDEWSEFKYHVPFLPCSEAMDGWAEALVTAIPQGWPSCPNHALYSFMLRTANFNCKDGVGVEDLLTILSVWGSCNGQMCVQDLNVDDVVDVQDVAIFVPLWGME